MKQSVLLVHRGISAQTHPVSGKSLKSYGTAVTSPSHGGVVFKMSMAEYAEAAHDLIGNTQPAQQWVPEIVFENDGVSRGKCCIPAGCPREADYRFGSDLYCAGHAPNNADPLYPGAPPIGTGALPAGHTPDVYPTLVEKPPTLVEQGQKQQLPVESITPAIGTDAEGTGAAPVKAPAIEKPVPIPSVSEMPAAAAPDPAQANGSPSQPTPEPTAAEKQQNVLTIMGQVAAAEVEKVMPALEARLESLVDGLAEKLLAAAKNGSGKRPQKKRTGGPDLAPTAMQVLQQRAKSLGINTFQKGKAALESEIAAIENPPPVVTT